MPRPKIADTQRRRKQLREMTNNKAGKQIMEMLVQWTTRTCAMDAKIKNLVDAAPGTLGQVIGTLQSDLQEEALAIIAKIDDATQKHSPNT